MPGRITPIKWQKFEKFLTHIGCKCVGQESSHRKWTREGLKRPIIVPCRELTIGVIMANLNTLGISRDEYVDILGKL
ncbi:MAG: type II toxin-antitoxin system HicA family toxin [bacterium]|nr:type II toxin-antitoxin system HicA family toxin [bacterium]